MWYEDICDTVVPCVNGYCLKIIDNHNLVIQRERNACRDGIYVTEAPSNAACALFRSYACQLVNYAVKASIAIITEYATLLHGQSGGLGI